MITFARGLVLREGDRSMEFERQLEFGKIQFKYLDNFEIRTFSMGALYSQILAKKIQVVHQSGRKVNLPDRVNVGDVESTYPQNISKRQEELIEYRMRYVRAAVRANVSPGSRRMFTSVISRLVVSHDDPAPPCPDTLKNWFKRYIDSGSNPYALMDRRPAVRKPKRFSSTVSVAADFSYRSVMLGQHPTPTAVIALSGSIQQGDTEKLAALVGGKHPTTGRPPFVLLVDTGGGDVVEAMKIGELIGALQMGVYVAPGGRCASACFFIFLEGGVRFAMDPRFKSPRLGGVGLHRPYLSQPNETSESLALQNNVMNRVTAYLEKKMVPRRLIDLMMLRPSNDIYWMTNDDLASIGDYTPEREELYISRCKYDRRYMSQLLDAEDNRDQSKAASIEQLMDNANDCIADLRYKAFYETRQKIINGWLPGNRSSNAALTTTELSKEEREKLVDNAHPGWTQLVKTPQFNDWLKVQEDSIQKLASSNNPKDAIDLLNRFKNESSPTKKPEKNTKWTKEEEVERIHPDWKATMKSGNFQRWLKDQPKSISSMVSTQVTTDLIRVLDLYKLDVERGR